jgi:hypothetical protein
VVADNSGFRLITVLHANHPVPVTPDLIQTPLVAGWSIRFFAMVVFRYVKPSLMPARRESRIRFLVMLAAA